MTRRWSEYWIPGAGSEIFTKRNSWSFQIRVQNIVIDCPLTIQVYFYVRHLLRRKLNLTRTVSQEATQNEFWSFELTFPNYRIFWVGYMCYWSLNLFPGYQRQYNCNLQFAKTKKSLWISGINMKQHFIWVSVSKFVMLLTL